MKLSNIKKGFTLVELLVVIAVLGVLAAVLLIAINPLEQMARGRDAGRKQVLGQLANALTSFYTSHNAWPNTANWVGELVTGGEIKVVPPQPNYVITGSAGCAAGGTVRAQNNWCMVSGAGANAEAIGYVRLESGSESSKCTVAGQRPYFLWSSADARAGIVCSATDPTTLTAGTYSYL